MKSQASPQLRPASLANSGETVIETLVENVTRLAAPSVLSGMSDTLVLFTLHDPQKPWYAATDIGTAQRIGGAEWSMSRIANDQTADFSPRVVNVNTNTVLAA